MRGSDGRTGALFSYVDLEARVPARHPLRAIRAIVNGALASLSNDFEALYAKGAGRRSRRRSCCGRCCCKHSTRCAPSVS